MIRLKFATVEFTTWGVVTRFDDGAEVPSVPHDTPHYYVIAHRCGYGDDLLQYCREHELAHEFLSEALLGRTSGVLWALAHKTVPAAGFAQYEEMATQSFQRWVRANERPIIGDIDWDGLKLRFLALLDGQQGPVEESGNGKG